MQPTTNTFCNLSLICNDSRLPRERVQGIKHRMVFRLPQTLKPNLRPPSLKEYRQIQTWVYTARKRTAEIRTSQDRQTETCGTCINDWIKCCTVMKADGIKLYSSVVQGIEHRMVFRVTKFRFVIRGCTGVE